MKLRHDAPNIPPGTHHLRFAMLAPDEQAAAVKKLAHAGLSPKAIESMTGLKPEQIQVILS